MKVVVYTLFLQLTDKEEIETPSTKKRAIKFKESLNSDKTYGPKNIYIISSKK